MTRADGERRIALHRSIVIWTGLFVLLVAAVFSAIGILNREVFSAPSFVRIYLDALNRHDLPGVLATPGVDLGTTDAPGTGTASLISTQALSAFDDISLVSDTEIAPGRHRIVYSYEMLGIDSHTTTGQTEFDVMQTGTSWLFFPEWEFARAPVAAATVTVSHASTFTAGTSQISTADPSAFHATGEYVVLVPSLTVLSHQSALLGAHSVPLAATKVNGSSSAIIDVQPTTTFLDEVQSTVDSFLDECAKQTVLYPPGCPFGLDVNDRIVTEPAWSIEEYPSLTILAGQDDWIVPNASGSAHITVDIRSLFDGTVSTRDESIPYSVTFSLTIGADGGVVFSPRA